MRKKSLAPPFLAALVVAALMAGHVQAQTQPAQEGDKPAKSKSKKTKAKSGSGGKVKFMQGSGETPAERTARLKRECKGAVDAGACSGYTR